MNVAKPERCWRMYFGVSAPRNFKAYLDALDGDLLGVHDDSVKVAGKDSSDSGLVLVRSGLAEVVHAAMDAREEATEARDSVLQPGLAFRLALVGTSLDELAQSLLQAVLELGLAYSAVSDAFP